MPKPTLPAGAERRAFIVDALGIEMRDANGVQVPLIRGHAAVFDQLSQDLGGFRERIAPGAFAKSITSQDVRALWNHNSDYVLGRRGAGTLRLQEDSKGLAIEIDPPDTQWAKDLQVSMQRGDINQMSFGFFTRNDKWSKVDGEWVRTLLEVEVVEVSPVTFPAYLGTDVSARTLEAYRAAQAADVVPPDVVPVSVLRHKLDLLT